MGTRLDSRQFGQRFPSRAAMAEFAEGQLDIDDVVARVRERKKAAVALVTGDEVVSSWCRVWCMLDL